MYAANPDEYVLPPAEWTGVMFERLILASLICMQSWVAACDLALSTEVAMSRSDNYKVLKCPSLHSTFGNIIDRFCFTSKIRPQDVKLNLNDLNSGFFDGYADFNQLADKKSDENLPANEKLYGDKQFIIRPYGSGSYVSIYKRATFAEDIEEWLTSLHPDTIPEKCDSTNIDKVKGVTLKYCIFETQNVFGEDIETFRFALSHVADHSMMTNTEYIFAYYDGGCGHLGLMRYQNFLDYFLDRK
jgi:hypothetical protein